MTAVTLPATRKTIKTPNVATDKARKAALAEVQTRVDALEAPAAAAGTARSKKSGKPAKTAKAEKPAKPKREPKAKRLGCLDAAAKVLADSGKPMKPKDMVEAMAAKGLWKSPSGKTPEATLYAAIIREISALKKDARFRKTERGVFESTGNAKA